MRFTTLFIVLAALAGSGCAPLHAYRTEAPPPVNWQGGGGKSCNLVDDGKITEFKGKDKLDCHARTREDSDWYRLYFAEFDDQGWSYPENERYGAASRQIPSLVEDLQALLNQSGERVSVVVFAHGWKHTARADDPNVESFRRTLANLHAVEQASASGCPRRIVGVYVGWRGAALSAGNPIENLTFWNRKEAAQRVAQGDVRTLFSHLRAIQETANVDWSRQVQARQVAVAQSARQTTGGTRPVENAVDPCSKRMRLSFVGHSFGGLIVYTSISQALIRDVVELGHAEAAQKLLPIAQRVRPVLQREGDLIIVVNPAIEATRFEPLFRAVRDADLPHYHTPMFVSVTSVDDSATKEAFRAGRWLSTRFDKYPKESQINERDANQKTLGHADDLLTHELTVDNRIDHACASWSAGSSFPDRLAIEGDVLASFRTALQQVQFDGSKLPARDFCGVQPMVLRSRGAWAGNSPVWNIRTADPIVKDHNDFENPRLLDVLRQLYVESEDREIARLK